MKNVRNLSITVTEKEKWMGIAYLPVELYLLPSLLQYLNGWMHLTEAELNFLFFALNFTAVLVIFHKFLGKCLTVATRNFWESVQAVILGFVAYDVCTWLISWAVIQLGVSFQNVNDMGILEMSSQRFGLIAIGVVFLVPVTEECLYRGVIFGGMFGRSRMGAYAVSTLVFAAIHVVGYLGSYTPVELLVCYIQYLPAGVWLAWSYEKSGTMIVPIIIHGIVNFMGIYGLR